MDFFFLEIIFIVFLLSIIQSILGVGLLIIGTPILLTYNLNFFTVLEILLPCSMITSLYQLINNKIKVSDNFKKILIHYCVPIIPIGLIFTHSIKELINFKLLIGFLILFLLILKKFYKINKITEIKKKIILVFIGLFHGLTNLGGTLPSLFLSTINKNKDQIKKEIDYGYLFMAGIQYFFLIFFLDGKFNMNNVIFITVSLLGCLISSRIDQYINSSRFLKLLNTIVFISAMIAIISGLNERIFVN